MNYEQLKTAIAEVIRTNGNEEITGEVLQYVLIEMVSSLGKDYQFAGIGTASTEVGTPDENLFWILRSGSYENFGVPFTVAENEFAVVMYNGNLSVQKIPVGRPVDDALTLGGENPVEGGVIAAEFAKLRAAGFLFAGIATRNSAPPETRSEKIFYLATQGGVYENYWALNLQQGLNVILWNGSTWIGQNLFTFTNEIAEGSSALPTAGAVFESLGTKVDKEEGKGLSEQNYTSSEKQKLADLPTALEITQMLGLKQDVLIWDNVPTEGSTHAIYSGAVFAAIQDVITKAVNDLVNYYTKSQTYSKTEVDNLIAAIKQFTIVSVPELPTASADTVGKIYLVPAETPAQQNVKDEYITISMSEGGTTTYSWECIGSTAIDLSNYPTIQDMNDAIAAALEGYLTGTEVGALIATAIADIADLSIEVNPAVILTNQSVAITLTARSQVAADSLVLTRGGSQVATGSGKMLTAIDNVNIQTAGVLTYLLTAVIAGVTRTKEVTVDVVDAVYYGAGTNAAAITTKATARRTPAGRYNITASAGDNLFVLVPYGMTVNGLRMSGIDVPMEAATGIIVDDKTYLCYQSSNVYDAGSYTIEVY
jgi:hypothetical protein